MKAHRISSNQQGFTLAELLIVIVVIGIVIGVASVELSQLNTNTKMTAAVNQISRSLEDAYSIAQAEKVTATVKFYSSSDSDADKRNRYEVLRNGVSMKPPIGLSYAKVGSSYYIKMPDGSSQPSIVSAVTVTFKPVGSTTRSVDETTFEPTSRTITLSYPGLANKTLTVNTEGKVSL